MRIKLGGIMNTIFVDLEMHPVARVYTKQFAVLKTETIEIGAVMLDEHLREISSFKEYVHPDFSNIVYAKYEKLTGITTEMLADADCFQSVFDRFCKWCGSDYTIYSWSDNDIMQLMRECDWKGIEYGDEVRYMFNHWKDFQDEFCSMLNLERLMSLTDAVMIGGLDFAGHQHDGLADARNTADLYRQTSDAHSEEFQRLLRNLEEASRPCTFSIREVVDFKQFDFGG